MDGTSADDPPYRRVSAVGMLVNAIGNINTWKSQTRFADIRDGLSHTIMMGEKHVRLVDIGTDDPGGDGPFLGSYAYSCMRVAGGRNFGATPNWPLAKGANDDVGGQFQAVFGSWHPSVVNFVWGDGSVRSLKTTTNCPPLRIMRGLETPIDFFVLARLEQQEISPAPEARREVLIRRLSLDLLGLPPRPEEVEAFVADPQPDAYQRLVDRILASPHFGERWGRHWLDLTRYADSDGYLDDRLRPYAWLYRDWVIAAINRDLPYDQFTIEQLAGDLLPHAAREQRVATGFHRNTLRNVEAGVDREEYRVKELVDRVATTGSVWLGLTLGCAECHTHKYDPITQNEFYRLFAFFNNAKEAALPMPGPDEMAAFRRAETNWQVEHDRLTAALSAASPTEEKLEEVLKKHLEQKPQPPATAASVFQEHATPPQSFVHVRGDYRRHGDPVQPGTPAVLPALAARGEHADRLDLARWLVDPANPLTARVTVNYWWQHLFGQGLVDTPEDFGTRGSAPSHPELLDWLASELLRQSWSRKAMIRLIVTSSTYRQSSVSRPELVAIDPLNKLLARQNRFRLEAEGVWDLAMSASGLLNRRLGGPSFRPPQPDYITAISRNRDWLVSPAPERHRRGMYILFRRATPYRTLISFDAPDSSVACPRRDRSNTPLQALTLLNDQVFFESAQAFSRRVLLEQPGSFDEQIEHAFRIALCRTPSVTELCLLRNIVATHRAELQQNPANARTIVGEHPVAGADPVDQAAIAMLGRVLLNLHEFVTRE
ncbi:MAG: DUF1549 domain-containing protein [Planctomycetes bacterium]|nr:DUF1549 domain-containing protein [Planctomycetota bacterium]